MRSEENGGFLAMDGHDVSQIAHMREVAEQWYEKLRVGHLTCFDAWISFNIIVMNTLEYSLIVLKLVESECTSIMAPMLRGGLPNMGMCRNMTRSLLYALVKHHGVGITSL